MGWCEGERVGTVGEGLDAPLTVIIKHSKLGLGARMERKKQPERVIVPS